MNASPKPSLNNRQPIYDDYLSVELHGRGGTVLWSYLAKPGKFVWNGVPQDLADRAAKNLLTVMRQTNGSRK